MRLPYRPWCISLLLFLFLSIYFVFTYKYYPGLNLSFSGYIEHNISGKLYWDYGYGFNELDSVKMTLFSDNQEQASDLGNIRIEPAGFKSDKSRGYLAWIMVPEQQYNSGEFTLDGKHHWGTWLRINNKQKGRQLALFPGASIEFTHKGSEFPVYIFKAPQAGFIKIQSVNGPQRYYDGYGVNEKWHITAVKYGAFGTGKSKYIRTPLNGAKETHFALPHQEIKNIKLNLENNLVKGITPFKRIRIQGSNFRNGIKEDNIYIKEIKINGQNIVIDTGNIIFSSNGEKENLIFKSEDDFVEVQGEIYSYDVFFAPESENRTITVKCDDEPTSVETAKNKRGVFRISRSANLELNQSSINKVHLQDSNGSQYTFEQKKANDSLVFDVDLDRIPQASFSGFLVSFQLILAGVVACLFHYFFKRLNFAATRVEVPLVKRIFYDNKRWLFWIVLVIGISVNFLYLAADWPGSMTPDSILVHKEIKWLKITNHHPYIYSCIVLALHNFLDAPVSVVLFQLIIFHLLCAYFFYFLYQRGVKPYVLLPLYLLVPLSIPANLFNLTLWKDIPYSIIVLFWAFFLTYLAYLRFYDREKFLPRLDTTVLLSGLFLLLCSLRHNGIVYLPFIPLALLIVCRVSKKWLFKFSFLSALLLILYFYILPPLIIYKKPKANNYAKMEVTKHVNKVASITKGKNDYFLEHYLGDRTMKFVATLGTSPKASTWYNDMHNPPAHWFIVDEARAEMATHPLSTALKSLLGKILETREYRGFTSGRFVFWNSMFALAGLVVVGLLYKWLPLSAFYSSIFLYQAFFMYFVTWERWRYLYFIYLGGMFLLPIVMLEIEKIRNRGNSRLNSLSCSGQ